MIVLIGAFIGPTIRRFTPRAAMLGTLAGISIAFISMRPAFQMFEVPWIALPVLGIILLSWTAGVRMPGGVPGGLLAVVVGTVIGWVAYLSGAWTGMDPQGRRRFVRPVRDPPADPRHRGDQRALGDPAAARHGDPARHLQLHRGDEQRRERLGRR